MQNTSDPFAQTGASILLAATPIGDSADASPRLLAGLIHADIIAAEDTRKLLNLCTRLGVRLTGDIRSFHEHNENQRGTQLLEDAKAGRKILVVSDAGMPTISDPGYRLVTQAVKEGIHVSALPGPSAVLTALSVSGLPTDRFCFEGFLPRKAGERGRYLNSLAKEHRTMVFFESAKRVHDSLTQMAEVFGAERRAVLCRELTKEYEEVIRATLSELVDRTQEPPRGEITLVISGAPQTSDNPAEYVGAVFELTEQGKSLNEAVRQVAKTYGLRKNDLYAQAIASKQ